MADEVAVVTGAASGIGLAIATALVARGSAVVLADVEGEELSRAARRLAATGAAAVGVVTDVRVLEHLDALAQQTIDRFGHVDMVFSNAGVLPPASASWEIADADLSWVFDVNVRGAVNTIRSFVPLLMAQGHGSFVVTSSQLGLAAAAGRGLYSASKHALVGLGRSLRLELAEVAPDVAVTVFCPGGVVSSLHDSGRNRPSAYGHNRQDASAPPTAVPRISADDAAAQLLTALRRRQGYVLTDDRAVAAARAAIREIEKDLDASPVR